MEKFFGECALNYTMKEVRRGKNIKGITVRVPVLELCLEGWSETLFHKLSTADYRRAARGSCFYTKPAIEM